MRLSCLTQSLSRYALCRLYFCPRSRIAAGRVRSPLCITPPHPCVGVMHSALYTARAHASTKPAATSAAVNYYERLQIAPHATAEEIKASYRRLALEWHPDVVSDARRARAEVQFRAISEAYEVLSDPVRRRAHDDRLGLTQPRSTPVRSPSAAGGAVRPAPRPPAGRPRRTATPVRRAATGKPFVRGDANRVFADAFDGKSLQQLLFEAQRRRRQEHASERRRDSTWRKQSNTSNVNNTKHEDKTSNNSNNKASDTSYGAGAKQSKSTAHHVSKEDDSADYAASASAGFAPAGREASMQRVLYHAAESFAARAQKLYGPSLLNRIQVRGGVSGQTKAAQPPQSHMPFRPFVHTSVPDGVTTPPDPIMGPLSHVNDPQVEVVGRVSGPHEVGQDGEERVQAAEVGRRFECRLRDGTRLPQNAALAHSQREIEGAAHNMGQLYSYHRPY